MKIIDAHSHIDSVIAPWQPNVVGAVCCAIDESEWTRLANLCANNNRIYGAFGIHPWFVDNVMDGFDNRLEKLL